MTTMRRLTIPHAPTFARLTLALLLLPACGKNDGDTSSGGGTASGSAGTSTSATGSATATTTASSTSGTSQGSASAGSGGTTTATTTATSTGTAGSSGGSAGSGGSGGGILQCGNKVYECGDGIDNDGDGKTDQEDPECTGPCDNDEGSFATGIPGDNVDCKQDCFFDGNSGSGDDKCEWNLKCDPENPGENIGCPYTPGPMCDNQAPTPTQECKDFCEALVPNGCDCFGCCRVSTPNGDVDIFLGGNPDCSLDNLGACEPCTYQADECGNPCDPNDCEVCLGEDAPPEGCDDPTCPNNLTPCLDPADCADGFYCLTGCCYPPPPG